MTLLHFTTSASNLTDALKKAALSEGPFTYFDTDQYIKNRIL